MTIKEPHGLRNVVRRWAAAAALAFVSLNAAAFRVDKTAELAWSLVGNTATAAAANGAPRAVPLALSSTATGVGLGGSKALPWPGKSQAENMAKWKMAATPREIAKGIMRPGALVGLAGSIAISALLDTACVRVFGGAMTLSDSAAWEECKFTTTNAQMYMVNSIPAPSGASQNGAAPEASRTTREAACAAWVQYEYWWMANRTTVYDNGFCYMYSNGNYVTGRGTQGVGSYDTVTRDGWQPASSNQAVEDALTNKATVWSQADFTAGRIENDPNAQLQPVLRELLDRGGSLDVAETPKVSGPATVPGNPVTTTTTAPNGDKVTTTTNTTNNYIYNDNRVTQTVTNSTSTTTTPVGGTPTTTTTTEEKTDERTQCEKDPKAFGCEQPDVPDGEVPKATKNVEFSPDNLGFGGGACPAPFTWSDKLGNHSLDLTQYCGVISNVVKPLVLLVAALMALAIAVPGMRGEVGE